MASQPASTPSIKPLPAVRVLSLRKTVENYRAQKDLWPIVIAAAQAVSVSIAGACFTIYYDLGFKPRNVDMEPRAAVVTHFGSYTNLPATYEKLEVWLSTEKLRRNGPVREVYVSMDHSDTSEASFVTELQQIVE